MMSHYHLNDVTSYINGLIYLDNLVLYWLKSNTEYYSVMLCYCVAFCAQKIVQVYNKYFNVLLIIAFKLPLLSTMLSITIAKVKCKSRSENESVHLLYL